MDDQLDGPTLAVLAAGGTRLIALRYAGFNNVDLASAEKLKMTVMRVPAYSPEAVAEHAVALMLALNRNIHHAYNRVRETTFRISGSTCTRRKARCSLLTDPRRSSRTMCLSV